MNQSMTPAQLETQLSIFAILELSFVANDQTPKEITFLLKSVVSLQQNQAWLLPWVTAVLQPSSAEPARQGDTESRLIAREILFLSILIAETAGRGISDFLLQ